MEAILHWQKSVNLSEVTRHRLLSVHWKGWTHFLGHSPWGSAVGTTWFNESRLNNQLLITEPSWKLLAESSLYLINWVFWLPKVPTVKMQQTTWEIHLSTLFSVDGIICQISFVHPLSVWQNTIYYKHKNTSNLKRKYSNLYTTQ